jgi:ribosomal protein S27E
LATTPQRTWRAACPNCGAPVDFASAASISAVCSFCRSTLVREGEALRRIGVSAELFDDHSPLQLGASGTRQGVAFTLVGRLQYGYSMGPRATAPPAPPPEGAAGPTGAAGSDLDGTWNEWHALFDNGPNGQRSAWLSEDNGAYVLAFDAPLPADAPALEGLRAGGRVLADGRAWDVASVLRARLLAAQGELPAAPRLQGEFSVVDLRNSAGEVATLDGPDTARPGWSVGRSVTLAELAMRGLKETSEKTLAGRALACPSCGAALAVQLASTQSLTCHQCQAVVDVSQGVGAALAHYQQNNAGESGAEPQIPLGRSGTLALGGPPLAWQVVGYQERCDIPAGADEETTFWREYLLYQREAGFAFLVDSNEGWSWVRPLTGAPTVAGARALWQGVAYRQRWSYAARTTWVQGEFYWRVQRDERTRITDYEGSGSAAKARLSREQSAVEVTWSAGETLAAAQVADAFAIAPAARAALQRDAAPLSSGGGLRAAIVMVLVVLVLVALLSQCSRGGCDEVRDTFGAASAEYQQCLARRGSGGGLRTGGGSYGGWSSGGSHK